MLCDYLVQILTARVYDVAQETPLEYASNLSARLNNKLLLKREDMQSVFSFKLRGAYNKMVQLPPDKLAQGAIADFARNHQQVQESFALKEKLKQLLKIAKTGV